MAPVVMSRALSKLQVPSFFEITNIIPVMPSSEHDSRANLTDIEIIHLVQGMIS